MNKEKDKTKKLQPTFDVDLLVETLSIQSVSHDDGEMMQWLKDKLTTMSLGFTEDSYGNLYVTKGKSDLYPCLVAHTDTVHKILKDFNIFECGDTLFAFSETEQTQVGIGGDDKVGISLCLNALKDLSVVKVAFFRNEEVGCLGSKQANMKFFDNCTLVLQGDRRGNKDFINIAAGTDLSSDEFMKAISPALKQHQYGVTRGSVTDVMALKNRGLKVCAANMSCGYWEPHTSLETVSVADVSDCYYLMMDIFTICEGKQWLHEYEEVVVKQQIHKPNFTSTKEVSNGNRLSGLTIEDGLDHRQLALEFEREAGLMSHNTSPMVDLDEESPEEYLEEIDICIVDLEHVLEDWKIARSKMLERLGKI